VFLLCVVIGAVRPGIVVKSIRLLGYRAEKSGRSSSGGEQKPNRPIGRTSGINDYVGPADGAVPLAVLLPYLFEPFAEIDVFEADQLLIETPDSVKVMYRTPKHSGTHTVP